MNDDDALHRAHTTITLLHRRLSGGAMGPTTRPHNLRGATATVHLFLSRLKFVCVRG